MKSNDFLDHVQEAQDRDIETLNRKGDIYTTDGEEDRFDQFNRQGAMNAESSLKAAWGNASKHAVAVAVDVQRFEAGEELDLDLAQEHLTDLRNYCHLMEGILEDHSYTDEEEEEEEEE